jgi:hypothetical protein
VDTSRGADPILSVWQSAVGGMRLVGIQLLWSAPFQVPGERGWKLLGELFLRNSSRRLKNPLISQLNTRDARLLNRPDHPECDEAARPYDVYLDRLKQLT